MWKIVMGIVLGLCGIGGGAYGYDQHCKRQRDRAQYRAELERLEARLREMEIRYGRQSAQFREIARELDWRRAQAA